MAKEKGVSLSAKDQTRGVGIGPGPVKITGSEFALVKKQGYLGGKAVPKLVITYERDGDEMEPEEYTVGSGWKVSEDGEYLIARGGQTGLQSSCKAAYLVRSLEDCDMPGDYFVKASDLIGIEGTLVIKEMDKISDDKGGKDRTPTVPVFESVEAAPWMEGAKKGKKNAKAKDEDDEDEDQEDEDDEDEEDEDEAPKRGAKKPAARATADDDEDDDSDDSEDVTETATEALLEALGEGDLKLKSVEGAVAAQIKDKKLKKTAAALAATKKFLERETGWSFDGKVVSLDS